MHQKTFDRLHSRLIEAEIQVDELFFFWWRGKGMGPGEIVTLTPILARRMRAFR
jgi:hypothetical protein